MKKKYGEKKIFEFRRSWNIKPDPLNKNNPYHPINIKSYSVKDFSISDIWKELVSKNKLYGYESLLNFYHLTDLKIYNELLKNK